MRNGPRRAAVVAVLLLLIGTAVPLASAGPASTASSRALPGGDGVPTSTSAGAAGPGVAPATPNCSLQRLHFSELYPGLSVPPGVPGATFGGCPLGADDAAVSLLSNGSGSASNASFTLLLPPEGSATGSAYALFSLRLAVSGIPCSVGGAAILSVELVPPESPYSAAPGPNWSVRTPAFDLVPSASCDPYCSNDTALVTLDGASFCEDEVLPASVVAAPGPGLPPGSTVSVAFRGTVGGAGGLSVWVNDSASPASDVARSFGPSFTSLGRPLEPLAQVAGYSRGLWDGAGSVSVAWTDCPLPAGPTVACNSYDPSFNAAAGTIAVVNASFVSGPSGTPTLYDEVATSSSTSGCGAGTPACSGTLSGGGAYPSWGLASFSGAAGLVLGSGPGAAPPLLGSEAAQVEGGGSAAFPPLSVVPAPIVAALPSATVSATVLDLSGASNVTFDPYYCSASSTPSEVPLAAVRVAGGPTDGTWNATMPIGAFTGTFPVAYSIVPGNGTPEFGGRLTSFNGPGGPACVFPGTPAPTLTNVTATALGYRVAWNDSDPALSGFSVNVSGSPGTPGVVVPETWNGTQNGTVSALLPLGAPGAIEAMNVTAIGLDAVLSPPSRNVTGPPTLSALDLTASASPGLVVGPGKLVSVAVNVTGGRSPYRYSIDLGNGAAPTSGVLTTNATVPFPLGTYQGTLRIGVRVTDAVGDLATAPPLWVPVWTTPLGVPQSSSAGDGFVSAAWGTPVVPGTPLEGYFVYSTTNASDVWRLASAGVVPGTFNGVLVSYTPNHTFAFVANDSSTLYAQVVGLCSAGLGQLPSGNGTLVGRPAPFVVSPITTVGGGVAPFTDSFSASVSGGSNDTLLSAIFSFPGFATVDATISGGNGTYVLDASYTFESPGTFVVTLHVTDSEYDVGLASTTVFVSPGAPPALSASELNAPAYNGSLVQFQAVATGGSGTDLYNWSFGDGSSANGSNPTHVYSEPGTYTAVIRATDVLTQGSNVTTFPVTVFTDPVVFVSVFPGPNGTDSFDLRASVGGGSGPSQVLWSFGDGTIAHGSNVSHDYDAPGTYTVNVTATDPAGHAGTTHYYLVVTPVASSGGGGPSGISPTLFWLVVAVAAGVVLVAILFAVRRPPPAQAVPVGEFAEEDGAVEIR